MHIFQKPGFVTFVIELAISVVTVKTPNQDASSVDSLEEDHFCSTDQAHAKYINCEEDHLAHISYH